MELKLQLEFCRKCINRERDANDLLLCSLTHKRASFEDFCSNYKRDESEPENALDDIFTLKQSEIKKKLDSEIYEKFRFEQNLTKAALFGLLASLIGAVIWAIISIVTGYQIGIMAIGIGAFVGYTIRYFGKGFEQQFALMGACIALLGCVLGNLFTVVGYASKEEDLGIFQILMSLDLKLIINVIVESFKFMDILFYGIAIYEGYRFATLQFTEKTLWKHTQKYGYHN